MKLRHLLPALLLVLPGVAWSAQCDVDLARADTAISEGPKPEVTAEEFEAAKAMVAEAASKLQSGDDVGCVATVGEALSLLQVADTD